MRTVINLTLPSPYSRLGLPPLRTKNKDRAEDMNRSALETFISEQCFAVAGETIEFALFYRQFIEWLPMERRYN